MTYRSDIVWIDITDRSKDILAVIKEHREYNYFPVCANKIDTVIGLLSVRDYLQSRLEPSPPNVQKILTQPLFIPESQTVERTLELLTVNATKAACIIDEYGGIQGFITKNGLLNNLYNKSVQPIGKTERSRFKQIDGALVASAQMSLDEVQALGFLDDIERSPTEEYYTLAGHLLAYLDAIPHQGDNIDIGSYICTILSMTGQRIDQVEIKKKEA